MSDAASRGLAVAVRLLPAHQRDWARAMEAELASIEPRAERRRYALGCARAVLTDPRALRGVAGPACGLAFGAALLGLALRVGSRGVRAETIALIAVLGAASWRGRRPGLLGPVGEDRSARLVRGAGYAVVAGCLLLLLSSSAGGAHDDPSGWWLACVAVTVYLLAVLAMTARGAAPPRAVVVSALAGLATWWAPMLLLGGLRAHPEWALLIVALTIVIASLAGARTGSPDEAAATGLAAGAALCLLIFVAALCTYRVFPELVPDIAGPPGAARVESTDPYVAELLLGALLGAVLLAVGAMPRAQAETG